MCIDESWTDLWPRTEFDAEREYVVYVVGAVQFEIVRESAVCAEDHWDGGVSGRDSKGRVWCKGTGDVCEAFKVVSVVE